MRNIFRIFTRDIKNIAKNWVAVVVVIGLMVIPSLYSLFNIKASWDPYGSTSGIKIAVVNEDKGTVFKEQDLNLGEELIDKLADNDKMAWTFVDKDTAKNGLLMEEYYAMIEIPENFSDNATTLVSKDVKKPQLIYTVNEKINAIAPKLTDAGVKSVKSQLDDNIVKTVSGVLFRICNETGVEIEENRPELTKVKDNIYELEESLPQLETILDSAIDGTMSVDELLVKVNEIIPNVADTIDITDEFLGKSYDALDRTQSELSDISPIIKEDLLLGENIIDTSSAALANLDENTLPREARKALLTASDSLKATKTTNENVISKLEGIKKFIDEVVDIKIKDIELPDLSIGSGTDETEDSNNSFMDITQDEIDAQIKHLKDMQKDLKEIGKVITNAMDKMETVNEKIDIALDRIDEKITKLDNGEGLDIQSITDIRSLLDDSHNAISDMISVYNSDIEPTAETAFNLGKEILNGSLDVVKIGRGVLPDVEKIISEFNDVSGVSREKLIELKDKFPDIEEKVHELADKLRELDEEDKIDEVLDMITNNWETQSAFFASPVEIEDNRLFKWPNYGSATTPFYTTLCLWIGGYMLSILLSTEVHHMDDGSHVKPYEEYFGKMLLFVVIGIFQALTASIGALAILGVHAIHPVMYVAFSVFVGIVFMIFIYTAVSVFGNGGIILGVVLLVLQVAGTSGNFPIEVNPEFFQRLFPYYPFTYAISGMRQVMAGIVYSILLRDIKILSAYAVGSIIFALVFKKFFNDKNMKFVKKLKESAIMIG